LPYDRLRFSPDIAASVPRSGTQNQTNKRGGREGCLGGVGWGGVIEWRWGD